MKIKATHQYFNHKSSLQPYYEVQDGIEKTIKQVSLLSDDGTEYLVKEVN